MTILTAEQCAMWIGRRAWRDTPATAPGTGVGTACTVLSAVTDDSAVTGARLRWTTITARTDSGGIVTGPPEAFRLIPA